MFASSLPLSVVFRVMDIFLMDGMEVIFRVGLALLERSHDQLLRLDLEDMTKVCFVYLYNVLLYCFVVANSISRKRLNVLVMLIAMYC